MIGQEAADACGTTWLPSDFKKKNGYRRSVELSAEYGLYRQDYCGCVFSKQEREAQNTFDPNIIVFIILLAGITHTSIGGG